MTHDEFLSLIKNPDTVTVGHIADLKEMIEYYPYFSHPKILLAKALHDSNNLNASKYANLTTVYCSNRQWLYYYLFPEKRVSVEPVKYERIPKYSGNYFDLMNTVEAEGGDEKTSLKSLAERLRAAREMVTTDQKTEPQNKDLVPEQRPETVRMSMPDYFSLKEGVDEPKLEVTEEYARKLIKEKKYQQAIEILKKLNLINPKKSIYFADQIRFLEKVLVNSKK